MLLAGAKNNQLVLMCAARHQFPDFMSESPFDGRVTRRVKMAANVIDRFRYRVRRFCSVFFC